MKSNNSIKTYYLKTFGCQMNYADSEKINMILLSAGLRKMIDPVKADIVIMNTCSVRQKGEDKVFGFMNEIAKFHKTHQTKKAPIFGITGCMVRKTGVAKRYLGASFGKEVPRNEAEDFLKQKISRPSGTPFGITRRQKRGLEIFQKRASAKTITLLDSSDSVLNYDDELFLRSPLIDFVFRIEEVAFLTKILSSITGEDIGNDAKFNEYLQVKQLSENPTSANVIIQTGCDNFCTYCIVPHTRGREISRPIHEIVTEVQEVVKNGAREITLLGQNVNSYGKETHAKLWNADELTWKNNFVNGGRRDLISENQSSASQAQQFLSQGALKTPFRELLDTINQIDGLDRIRFTSSNPHDMTRDILDAHFELLKMCNYLHFALQSGSDTMLRRMNRKHTYADFKAQLDYLRSRDPLFAISTDIIVGFPGETEEEFQATVTAMQECQFDFAYIARYSPRTGTIATEKYEDDISPAEKTRRWTILNDVLRETVRNRNLLMIGREEEVLISGRGRDDDWVGRTRNFKEVNISGDALVSVGDIVRTKITQLDGWALRGEVSEVLS